MNQRSEQGYNFEHLTMAQFENLSPAARAHYEQWFSAWMAAGFPKSPPDTFDIETERREGWGYQEKELLP